MIVRKPREYFVLIYAILCLVLPSYVNAQQNSGSPVYPFPQNRVYPYGFKATTITGADATAAYNDWKTTFAENCNGTWRIKFDNTSETVSEGIAYGMVLAVFHADKPLFDGLWQYYKNARNANGVMHWKRGGCANTAVSNNGATDAELDAAFALIIANCQWPTSTTPHNYKSDATALINAIKAHEVESGTYVLKPGDAFGGSSITNPSYFSPAYFRVFAEYVPADAAFWNSVASKCHEILNANAHSTTGLVSDWCDGSGTPGGSGYAYSGLRYHYDAARTPWRFATDYLWWGNANAQTWCKKLVTWVNGPAGGIANIGDSYEQNGTKQSPWHNSTFVGAFASAAMASSQSDADKYATDFKNIPASSDAAYFQRTLRALYYLQLTGNFWYPCSAAPASSVSVSITSPANGASFAEGANIAISAGASTTSGSISKVEFFYGNVKIGEDLSSPYSITWSNVPSGSHTIKAVATSSANETAEATITVNVHKAVFQTSTVPVLDGTVDAVWGNHTAASITKSIAGTVSSATDLSASWKAMWDNTNLYVLVQVTDDIKRNDGGTDAYNDDAIEIYADIGNSKSTSYGTNDFQYTFRWNDAVIREINNKSISGVSVAQAATSNGYVMEVKIPWSTLTATPSIDQLVGFDVHVNDDDDGGTRDSKMSWNALTDDAWQNPSLFGTIILKGTNCTSPGAAGTISGNTNVCSGSVNSYSIASVSGATGYTWTVPSGATINSGQGTTGISVTFGTTGGSVTVTPTNSCGNGTASSLTVSVTAASTASVTAASDKTSICSGETVTFSATPTNGGTSPTYKWQKNGTDITGATSSSYSTSTLTSTDKFRVIMTSNAACVTSSPATSNEVSVTVNASVTASVMASSDKFNICSGETVTFAATSTSGGTSPSYKWQKNGKDITGATSATYSTSTLTSTDKFRVVMTSNATCVTGSPATSNEVSVTVNPTVTASVTATSDKTSICEGETVTFAASPTNGGTSPTYKWQKNGTDVIGATSATYSTSTLTSTDKFRVIMTSNAACVTGSPATSNEVSVTVSASVIPSVTIAADKNPACSGEIISFTTTSANGGTTPTYQWQINNVDVTGASSSSYSSSTLNNGDLVRVIMTSSSTCASTSTATSNEVTMTINASSVASVSISTDKTTTCSGELVTFTASPVNGGTTPGYQWQKNSIDITGATSATYGASDLTSTDKIRVIMTSTLSCATGSPATSNEISVTVNTTVTASLTASSDYTSICEGETVTLTAVPTNGGTTPSYQWQINQTDITGATGATYSTSSLTSTDKFRVIMTSNATCVTGSPATSNEVSVTVSGSVIPSVTIAADKNPACSGETVSFTATPTNGGASPTYQWQINSVDVTGATGSTYSSSTLNNGDLVRVIMTSSSTCASTATATSNEVNMTISTSSVASVSISSDKTTSCSGDLVTFSASPVNGGTTPGYQWQKNSIDITGATSATYAASDLTSTDKIRVIMTSILSCVTGSPVTSNEISVTVNSTVTASVTVSPEQISICEGETVTFVAYATNGGMSPSYQWQLNQTDITSATSATYSTSTLANADQIRVIMTSNATCVTGSPATSNEVSVTVSGTVAPSVTIAADKNPACAGETVTFTATPTNGGTTPTYQWQINGIDVTGATSTTYSSSTLNNGDLVRVIMTSSSACASTATSASNEVAMTINTSSEASVSISADKTTICSGETVTFAASPVNGGTTPGYQWQKNGIDITGATSATYAASDLTSADLIRVIMTSDLFCAIGSPAVSNEVLVTVNDAPVASVSASADKTTICLGDAVIFAASPTNGGNNPVYQWLKNATAIPGATSSTFTATELINNDDISVVMTSSLSCASGSPATSDPIVITVNTVKAAEAGLDQILCGTSTAMNANTPGNNTAVWTLVSGSGNIANPGNNKTNITGLGVGENVFVWTLASGSCSSSDTVLVTSTAPSVSIAADAERICTGSSVTFTATPVNGGDAPSYEWFKNGVSLGVGTRVYTVTGIINGDAFRCNMTSSLCNTIVSSKSVVITVDEMPSTANAGTDQFITTTSSFLEGNSPLIGNGTWTLVSGAGLISNPGSSSSGVSNLNGGANTYKWTISSGVCPESSDEVVINIGSEPSASEITGPDQVEPGQTVTYSVPEVSGSTYSWTVPDGATIISGDGTGTVTVDMGTASSGYISLTETNQYGSTTSSKFISVLTSITGINSAGINVYPNPFANTCNLQMNGISQIKVTIKVSDVNGVEVVSLTDVSSDEEISLGENLPTGVYLVRILHGDKVETVKLVKVK